MADEDEVDVEGDFDMKFGALSQLLCAEVIKTERIEDYHLLDTDALYDMNEPPSKSANLLPEFTQHPWVLEQGWSLDHCTDERSKAAIEKMLLEEQQYINGKSVGSKMLPVLPKVIMPKRAWTDEERQTFMKGLEIYGRSWSRIAEFIPGKTVQQVKSYGQHYFKMKAKEAEEQKKRETITHDVIHTNVPLGIEKLIAAVTTGQPTVTLTKRSNVDQRKPVKDTSTPKKSSLKKPLSSKAKTSSPRKQHGSETSAGNNLSVKKLDPCARLSRPSIAIDGSEVVRIPSARDTLSDDSDVEIDVDVDSDEEETTPNRGQDDEVYKKLVESAGIVITSEDEEQNKSVENGLHYDINSSSRAIILNDTKHDKKNSFKMLLPQNVQEIKTELTEATPCCHKTLPTKSIDYDTQAILPPSSTNIKCSVCVGVTAESRDTNINTAPNYHISPKPAVHCDTDEKSDSKEEADGTSVLSVVDDVNTCNRPDLGDPEESDTNPLPYRSGDEDSYEDGNNSTDSRDGEDYNDHPNEFGILTSTGEIVYLSNPAMEVKLGPNDISADESRIHSEFFTNRPGSKNPDRYLKIRNFILEAWEKSRPTYLNKTSVRPGLKNCGDVNCIGRIHAYLEQVGAINFGCSQVQYRRATRCSQVKVKKGKDRFDVEQVARIENMRPRKRRVRDNFGQWVDEKDLEGRTIEHKPGIPAVKRTKIRGHGHYDPFKLIPCENFSSAEPAPFIVKVESCALVTMDVHAHMSKTEVIGLLGGEYSESEARLLVTMAVPCDSLSTGMQCEMDPVSQTEASEQIGQAGQSVVGWYHSHPTFVPNPSCRDLETQQKFQDWFGQGGSPFVGVIVSPYCHGRLDHQSQVRCLVVSRNTNSSESIGSPYQFDFEVSHNRWREDDLVQKVCRIIKKYAQYPNRVQMLRYYFRETGSVTCLDKMLDSLQEYFPKSVQEDCLALRDIIKDNVLDEFKLAASEGDFHIGDEEDPIDPPSHMDEKLSGGDDEKRSVDCSDAEEAETDEEQEAMVDL